MYVSNSTASETHRLFTVLTWKMSSSCTSWKIRAHLTPMTLPMGNRVDAGHCRSTSSSNRLPDPRHGMRKK